MAKKTRLPADFIRQNDALKEALRTLDLVNSPAIEAAADLSAQLEATTLPPLEAARKISRQLEGTRLPVHEAGARISRQLDAVRTPQVAAAMEMSRRLESLRLPALNIPGAGSYASPVAAEGENAGAQAPARPEARQAVPSVATLGVFLKATRQRMGLTQQDLADIAGVGRRFISELEAGKPTLEVGRVLKACASLGVDLFAEAR